MTPQWRVGIRRSNGVVGTIDSGSHVTPSAIDTVYFPIRFVGHESGTVIETSPLEQVGAHSRSMGREIWYEAAVERVHPTTEEICGATLEIWEYPPGAFNMSEMRITGDIEMADIEPDDLIQMIE